MSATNEGGGEKGEKQEGSEQVYSELQCSICWDYFHLPVTLGCGHTFCKYCITDKSIHNRNCPLCRSPLGPHFSINTVLQNLINTLGLKRKMDPKPAPLPVDQDWWAVMFIKQQVSLPLFLKIFLQDMNLSTVFFDDLHSCVLDWLSSGRRWKKERWMITEEDCSMLCEEVGYSRGDPGSKQRMQQWVENYVAEKPAVIPAKLALKPFVLRVQADRVHRIEASSFPSDRIEHRLPWDAGRHALSTIQLAHPSVSLSHLIFVQMSDGGMGLVDCGSTIGTMIKIASDHELQDGDVIHIGDRLEVEVSITRNDVGSPYEGFRWDTEQCRVLEAVRRGTHAPPPGGETALGDGVGRESVSPRQSRPNSPSPAAAASAAAAEPLSAKTKEVSERPSLNAAGGPGSAERPSGVGPGLRARTLVPGEGEEGDGDVLHVSEGPDKQAGAGVDGLSFLEPGEETDINEGEGRGGGGGATDAEGEGDGEGVEMDAEAEAGGDPGSNSNSQQIRTYCRISVRGHDVDNWVDPRGVVLGRGPHAQSSYKKLAVTTNNGYVSREHCLIFYDGQREEGKRWILRDVSTLGTFLRVRPFSEPVPIPLGSVFKAGQCKVELVAADHEGPLFPAPVGVGGLHGHAGVLAPFSLHPPVLPGPQLEAGASPPQGPVHPPEAPAAGQQPPEYRGAPAARPSQPGPPQGFLGPAEEEDLLAAGGPRGMRERDALRWSGEERRGQGQQYASAGREERRGSGRRGSPSGPFGHSLSSSPDEHNENEEVGRHEGGGGGEVQRRWRDGLRQKSGNSNSNSNAIGFSSRDQPRTLHGQQSSSGEALPRRESLQGSERDSGGNLTGDEGERGFRGVERERGVLRGRGGGKSRPGARERERERLGGGFVGPEGEEQSHAAALSLSQDPPSDFPRHGLSDEGGVRQSASQRPTPPDPFSENVSLEVSALIKVEGSVAWIASDWL
uniref:E3 ubiquitin-protein ligase CHFR n=1 Tax=Chromera velia CCMP2878 TaxID=1169474 RepID=A0A0G4HDE7_9ALVE|eukprot:Cvel_6447.t1-p1 / transcript=Cvel_6447.t1 / gene=Cvel_6447 / organism=Chromera_velia_CCMP2878 / gene_product=LON peptidase N-terminal domain and RING finger, putative / transcript_product=LON peptidase N-terminal domain and RING finger, putative / location=Cvel_scaffold315:86911-94684(-) / protein_length=955 / sequence_SO=supercontig / SO=protein_coding / is_pseudo=false